MGIFDFLKGNSKGAEKAKIHINTPERNTNVRLEHINEGNHGDHWAGIFGFSNFYDNPQVGSKLLSLLSTTGKKQMIDKFYEETRIDLGSIEFLSITRKQKIQTSYPIVKSTVTVDSISKTIKEWKHVNGIEAQIEGKCKNTFGISYFATDYLKNKEKYASTLAQDIQLSGVAYSIHSATPMEGFAENFVGYTPSKEYGKFSVIDFVGEIVDLKHLQIPEYSIEGYIARIRLIQMDEDKDFFCLDTFVNKSTIQTEEFEIGNRISGMIWIQGRIAE